MEIDEAVARVVRRHLTLLVIMVLIPVLAVVALTLRAPRQYQASARILVSNDVPTSAIAAQSLVDLVRAIATSVDTAASALQSSHLKNDPTDLVKNHVAVSGLGSSPAVELRVTDRDALVAQRITQALAQRTVDLLNTTGQGAVPQALAAIDSEINTLSTRWADVVRQLNANPHRPDAALLNARQAGLDRQIADLAAERSRLTVSDATRTRAVVTGSVQRPATAMPRPLLQRGSLAVIAGLVLGLILAAVIEVASPTLPNARAVSRFFSAPLLGRFLESGRAVDVATVSTLRDRLWLAALQADAATVVLAGPLPESELQRLTRTLQITSLPPARTAVATPSGGRRGAARAGSDSSVSEPEPATGIRFRTLDTLKGSEALDAVALAVVAPGAMRRAEAESLQDLLASSGWPLLGVVDVPQRHQTSREGA